VSQPPFFEDRPGHREGRPRELRLVARTWIREKPGFELFRRGVGFDRAPEKVPLDAETEGVGCLIALAFSSTAFRGFESSKEGPAHVGWTKRLR
jgi:hypothetical protein